MLAAAVLVLLPALAWLQYSWLDQIADADRERRERTLQTAASQLAQDFEGEISKAAFGLQLEPSIVEQQAWSSYAERYQLWAATAMAPDVVEAVYFVEAADEPAKAAEPPLRVWNTLSHTFDDTPWPEALAPIRARFVHDSRTLANLHVQPPRRGDRGVERDRLELRGPQRLLLPPMPTGDEQSIVLPIVRITVVGPQGDRSSGPPDVKLLGFTILRLNLAALVKEVLPVLVRRHLQGNGSNDFLVAVLAREDPSQVIFESEPGAARSATDTPDATISLLGVGSRIRPLMWMQRDGDRSPTPSPAAPVPQASAPAGNNGAAENSVVVNIVESRRNERGTSIQTRTSSGSAEGHWRLVAKHRAGSLEVAVDAARTRNFVLSSGILLLLGTSIGLIVVSARRADHLARQQLEFVAAVSHELRTPVSVIGAAAGNLADGVVEEPGRVKKYGATIQTEARRLAETVERVLQLAGIAAGRAAASQALVPGHLLIDDTLGAVRHEMENAGVIIERSIPDTLPSVRGDAMALRSALQNLLGNAVKYAGDNRWVRLSAEAAGRTLRITVEDHGMGIRPEDRKHIFEPFYRGREAVSRQIQGSGLGLHLVRRIIEAHGGSVSVQSEVGKGSTFIVDLPIASDGARVEGSGAPDHSQSTVHGLRPTVTQVLSVDRRL